MSGPKNIILVGLVISLLVISPIVPIAQAASNISTASIEDNINPVLDFTVSQELIGYDGRTFFPSTFTLSVSSTDNSGLDRIVVNRINVDGSLYLGSGHSWVNLCRGNQQCSRTITYSRLSASDLENVDGFSLWFQAIAYDLSGNHTDEIIRVILIQSRKPFRQSSYIEPIISSITLLPTVRLFISPEVPDNIISSTQDVTVHAKVINIKDVSEIRLVASPTWSNTIVSNRCFPDNTNKRKLETCSLDLRGLPAGYTNTSNSIQIWAFAWDAKTGVGYGSKVKTLTVVE
jgi:hypothetical protein